ncbi:MAG: hypothetical protein SPI83_05590, partial [Rothia sp. (in: high G+C Gram-positive bacteria)]|nr:hypothetical protein [Rothia sp. (in: high G+C Gram-positive bacteria)]
PPHLRVIDGEADPVEMAKAQHPSNGSQEQHNIALAREVTPPSDTEQAEEEVAHEDSPHAVSLEPVPTSEGLAEQGHKDADNAALQEEAQSDRTKPQGPVAYEYGDYDGGYFDDASVDEPEYVAGVGYLKPETPPVAPLSGAPLAQAPQAHVTQPQAAQTQAVQAQAAQAQAAQAQAAQAPTAQPQASAQQASAPQSKPAGGQPGGKKLSFRERHAAQIAAGQRSVQQAQAPAPAEAPEDFTPSDDDAALESSVLIGQRAVEKILGGKVIDEQPLHQG